MFQHDVMMPKICAGHLRGRSIMAPRSIRMAITSSFSTHQRMRRILRLIWRGTTICEGRGADAVYFP